MDAILFDCFGYVMIRVVLRYVLEERLEPAVAQLQKLDPELGLAEHVQSSNYADDFQTLIELKISFELLQELFKHEIQRFVDVIDDLLYQRNA
jgi:hypothetical protein